jgi:hypothetical protein
MFLTRSCKECYETRYIECDFFALNVSDFFAILLCPVHRFIWKLIQINVMLFMFFK